MGIEDIVEVLWRFDSSRGFIAKLGQFKNWQKAGAFGVRPGRGRASSYGLPDAITASALNELTLMGLSPSAACETIGGMDLSWSGFTVTLEHSGTKLTVNLAPYKEAFVG